MPEERGCRYDDEAPGSYGPRTWGLFDSWYGAASRKTAIQAELNGHKPDLATVFSQVKNGFGDIATMHAANDDFTLDCPETVERINQFFQDTHMDPLVLESFHLVRAHYPDPTSHVSSKFMIEQLAAAL